MSNAANKKPSKKPWPSDAIMIVAASAGEEIRENMESVVRTWCRDCGRLLHADSRCIREAGELDCRDGRPIKFFCVECCVKYDVNSVHKFLDMR